MLPSLTTVLSAMAALAAVVGLIVLSGRAARLTGLARTGTTRRLQLQDSLVLDRSRKVSIVRCDGRDLLLVTGGTSDQVVGWLPSREDAP